MGNVLEIKDLEVSYGKIQALKGINLSVQEGEIITLIGANGAGKSTTMNAIMGLIPLQNGSVQIFGKDCTGLDTRKIVKMGTTLVPEGRQVFPDLTVYDNLMLGGYFQTDKENHETLKTIYEMFPILEDRKDQIGLTLSGGEQQMLAVGRAMMSKPKLLLLDEPSLGLAPLIVQSIFEMIRRIRELGVTILLVEQNARMALRISDRAYVMESGVIVSSGEASELLKSESLMNAYLGKG